MSHNVQNLPHPFPSESFTAWAFRAAKALRAPSADRKVAVRMQLQIAKAQGYSVTANASAVLSAMGEAQAEAVKPRKRKQAAIASNS